MIRLEVQPYCESCREFEADVEKPGIMYCLNVAFDMDGDTIIRCENRDKCERIKSHLIEEGTISSE